jgi:hypothetical protein
MKTFFCIKLSFNVFLTLSSTLCMKPVAKVAANSANSISFLAFAAFLALPWAFFLDGMLLQKKNDGRCHVVS